MYINDKQEQNIRKICCPFYTSSNYQVLIPDFFIFSQEGYNLDDLPRACYKRVRLYGKDRLDDFMLCDISPYINGQGYGLGDKDITQIVIANRVQGTSLFPISEWPISVYLARITNPKIESKKWVDETNISLIACASLYQLEKDTHI
jgi:hypothetical protein